jgi:hypothetical protein
MSKSTLPKFISYLGHGEVDFAAPLLATDDLLYGFALESDRASVQALVDSTLAAPAKGKIEYRVLGNHVLLVFQHTGHFSSPINIGWAQDHETAFMIPLIEKRPDSLSPVKLVLWMPYLMIDVGLGMITGRDVWGYNKSLGTTLIPSSPSDPPVFNCKTLVFETFAPDTQARVDTLIEVTRADATAFGELTPEWSEGSSAIKAIEKTLGPFGVRWIEDVEVAVDLVSLLVEGDVPVINLKQMRDTEETELAVVQSLVAAMLRVTKFHSGGLLHGSYTVKIRQCDSHQIGKDFGFPTGNAKPGEIYSVPSKLGFWVKLDFNAAAGKTVWTAT